MWAARCNNEDVCRKLLELGADPNQRSDYGHTPLLWAYGAEGPAKVILKHGADPNQDDGHGRHPLSFAAEWGHLSVVRLLLDHPNTDINKQGKLDGRTALFWGAMNGRDAVVESLLRKLADPNIPDKDGRSPLAIAIEKGHDSVVT